MYMIDKFAENIYNRTSITVYFQFICPVIFTDDGHFFLVNQDKNKKFS